MKRSVLTLISAIWTAILLLVLACAGGYAIGMFMAKGAYVVLVPLFAVFGGLLLLVFTVLGEDIQDYQEERKAEKLADSQHDWPFNHLRS
jgi:hypothetical protein